MGKLKQISLGMVTLVSALVLAGCSGGGSKNADEEASSARSSKTIKMNKQKTQKRASSSAKKSIVKTAKKQTNKTNANLLLTFMGDNTMVTDPKFNAATSLPTVWAQHGNSPTYFFQNVAKYFQNDDLTIANLETTLTTTSAQKFKGTGTVFHFKGNPAIVKTLTASGIDAVTVANNHIYDFGQQGFADTVATLKGAGVGYFGEGYKYITTVKGVKIGMLGYQGWTATTADLAKIKTDIKDLRNQGCNIVIPYFHWGIEKAPRPNATQTTLAHAAIDAGADMVIGSHPHVIESMEQYKGKLIAYSMSNFCFGGNSHPSDMRSFILQADVKVQAGKAAGCQFKVIPTRISSTTAYNDYKPTPYTGSEATGVLNYMNSLSPTLKGKINNQYFTLN